MRYSNAYKRDNKRYSGKSSEKKPEISTAATKPRSGKFLQRSRKRETGRFLHTRRNLTGRKSQNRMYGLRMRKSAKPMRLWIRLLWM